MVDKDLQNNNSNSNVFVRIFKTFKKVVISSGIISVICFLLGIYFSYVFNISTGAMIVLVNLFVFIVCSIIEGITN